MLMFALYLPKVDTRIIESTDANDANPARLASLKLLSGTILVEEYING